MGVDINDELRNRLDKLDKAAREADKAAREAYRVARELKRELTSMDAQLGRKPAPRQWRRNKDGTIPIDGGKEGE